MAHLASVSTILQISSWPRETHQLLRDFWKRDCATANQSGWHRVPDRATKLSRTTNHLPTTKTAKFRSARPSSLLRPATQQVGCSAVVIGFSLHRIPSYDATSSAWQSVLLRKRITGVFNFVVRQLEILEIPRNWINELWFPLFYSALHVATGLCHETARHIRRPK